MKVLVQYVTETGDAVQGKGSNLANALDDLEERIKHDEAYFQRKRAGLNECLTDIKATA